VIVFGLVLRVALVLGTRRSYHPVNDPVDFYRIARSILAGHGFGSTVVPGAVGPSAFRTPLYPAFLAAVFGVFGTSITVGRLATAVVSALVVPAVGELGRQIGGRRVGVVTLTLAAIYPPFLVAGYGLMYEPLFLLLTTCSLILMLRWYAEDHRTQVLVGAGGLAGLAVLCRETAGLVLVTGVLLISARMDRTHLRQAGRSALALVLPAVVVVVPWTIRNAIELHSFIPVSDSPGEALAGTYNATTMAADQWTIGWVPPFFDHHDGVTDLALGPAPKEATVMRTYQHDGTRYVFDHPGSVPKTAFWNSARMFGFTGFSAPLYLAYYIPWNPTLARATVVAFWVVAPIAAIGWWTAQRRKVPNALWAYPALTYILLAVTVGDIQYRVALEPFVLILAAMAVASGAGRWLATGRSAPSALLEHGVEVVPE
jgi:4-amino-4-deoxy-L-arabinose transferase-like glycosyltransferase